MSPHKLPHYIKAYRKRTGFSQDEVAFLLASGHSAAISRYEHFAQQPNLETAIALEILFRTPVRGIFAGVSEKVARNVMSRAEQLSRKLEREPQVPETQRKIEALRNLRADLGQMPAHGA